MKKFYFLIALVLGLVLAQDSFAQYRFQAPLKVRYPNGQSSSSSTAADTMMNGTSEDAEIALAGPGGLSPIAITVMVTTSDADISATPDSLNVIYLAGIGSQTAALVSATPVNEIASGALGTWVRTFVINTTGAALANNTQASVTAPMEKLILRLNQASNDGDSTKYVINAIGVFQSR